MNKELTIIGRAEKANFPASELVNVPVKIDTGAYRSSIWATDVREENGKLYYKLLGDFGEYKAGKEQVTENFEIVEVENSFGHSEERYSIFLSIEVAGRRVRSNFTLSDRSKKTYPVLIGRKLLRKKFIVDVSKGSPIADEEEIL